MKANPPRWTLQLLRWFCREDCIEEIEGNLTEIFHSEYLQSPFRARRNFCINVIRHLRPEFIRSFRPYFNQNTTAMFRNYFKTAWRNTGRNRTFSFIKILGLSLALTVCMLILLYTKDEISYDRFHANATRLYRVNQILQRGDADPAVLGVTNSVVGETFMRQIPGVETFVRLRADDITVKTGNDVFFENCLFTDSNFFSVFSFPLIHGAKTPSLSKPDAVVLSEDMAEKYFGKTDVVGYRFRVKKGGDDFESYTVTAVCKNLPENSSIQGGIFFPVQFDKQSANEQWYGGNLTTFLLFSGKASAPDIEKKMQALYKQNTSAFISRAAKERGIKLKAELFIQPLTDIHLSTFAGAANALTNASNPVYSYILASIAIFILIIACINFINLSVAQSLKRSKEIAVRKMMGSTRKQIISQFLSESLLVSLLAFGIAAALTRLLLPFFNNLAGKDLSIAYLSDGYLYVGLLGLLVITSLASGLYPAFLASTFQPIKVIGSRLKLSGRNYFTKSLVVLQFSLAVLLVVGTSAVYQQVNLLLHADPGYDSKNLVRIKLPQSGDNNLLTERFKNELGKYPGILNVAARNSGQQLTVLRVGEKLITAEINKIDSRFLATLRIPILAGRNFSDGFTTDSFHTVIVNEAFAREAGWKIAEAISKSIISGEDSSRKYNVAAVVKDFNAGSLKEKTAPMLFSLNPNMSYGELWVKVTAANVPILRTTFEKLVSDFPYSYDFIDENNARHYVSETRWKQIIGISSCLFLFISCIGLFGLVMLSIEQRTKEIGIRKVMGAAATRIVLLISKEFIFLILIAFAIAMPVAYFAVSKWLEEFARRIEISWLLFFTAGAAIILTAITTVSFQTIKAALTNPIKSLRME